MADVTFYGGPCKGEHRTLAADPIYGDRLVCKGASYYVYPFTTGRFAAILAPVVEPPTPVGAPVPKVSAAAHAWKDLIRGATRTAPRYLQESARYRRAMLRIGRR